MTPHEAQQAAILAGESPETKALRARVRELEDAVRAALNMVDGNGIEPDWDWMRAVMAGKSAEYFKSRLGARVAEL